jgi:hypothetical protein
LHLDRAVSARVEMRDFALDVQILCISIEDQRATIGMGDLRTFHLPV